MNQCDPNIPESNVSISNYLYADNYAVLLSKNDADAVLER